MDQPDSDTDWVFVGDSKEAVMQRFIHRQNLEHFRERLAEGKGWGLQIIDEPWQQI